MSDLSAAAAAMGIPESLVQRSAEARAQETGSTVDEILAAWAAGESGPSDVPEAPAESVAEPIAEVDPAPEPVVPAEAPAEALDAAPAAVIAAPPPIAAGPVKPPVLVGTSDNPLSIVVGAIGLFVLIFLVGLLGPSIQPEEPGARSSEVQLSQAGEEGLALYSSLGCAACHTQMVRPVVADVGLGAVTLNDANQPLGTRRFGPDLSDIGSRMSGSQMEAVINGFDGHPSSSLSSEDMNALVTYLLESNTSEAG